MEGAENGTGCQDFGPLTSNMSLIFLSIFLVSINVVVVMGNIMVIAAAKTSKKLRNNVTVLFVISLAMSDLMLGVFVLPFSIVNQVLDKRWIFGKSLCYIWLAVDVWLFTASILNLVVISFDRFLAIRLPTRYPDLMTKRWARFLVLCAWSLAFVICFPTILQILKPGHAMNSTDCAQQYACTIATSSPSYIIYSAMGSFYIPLLVMCYFYLQIYLVIRQHARGIRRGHLKSNIRRNHTITLRVHYGRISNGPLRTSTKSTVSSIQKTEPEPASDSGSGGETGSARLPPNLTPPASSSHRTCSVRLATNSDKKVSRFHRETKAARTLGIVCGAFTLCLLPFFSVYLSGAFCKDCVPDIVFDIAFWLGYCNSALNPAIYALFSREFRRAFIRLLGCRCKSTDQSWRSMTYVL